VELKERALKVIERMRELGAAVSALNERYDEVWRLLRERVAVPRVSASREVAVAVRATPDLSWLPPVVRSLLGNALVAERRVSAAGVLEGELEGVEVAGRGLTLRFSGGGWLIIPSFADTVSVAELLALASLPDEVWERVVEAVRAVGDEAARAVDTLSRIAALARTVA